jgi:hypothetical protein
MPGVYAAVNEERITRFFCRFYTLKEAGRRKIKFKIVRA